MSTPLDSPTLEGTTLTEERLASTDDGDHERFAHYVQKDKIVESAVTGKPVRALCGKKWVPGRDPSKFPVCPECQEIYSGLKPGKHNGPDGDS
ncbi:MAG: hypothetical protein RL134_1090 [Actinomycetota bacterium]|jgi:hypothetical protein